MGFIFRTIFWLGLATVILPPKARLGGDGTADFRDVDISFELHNAVYGLWSLGAQAASACDTNPQLCKAGSDLVDASFAAANTLARLPAAFRVTKNRADLAPAPPPIRMLTSWTSLSSNSRRVISSWRTSIPE